MIKKIKKALFFLFFLNTSIFPMQQVAMALLARKTLIQSALIEQKRFYYSTPCLRSPLNDYLVDLTIEQVTDFQGETMAKVKCFDVPPANNSSNNIAVFLAGNKSTHCQQGIIMMNAKETWNNNQNLEHATDTWQKKEINKSCASEMVSNLSQQVAKAALIAKNKMYQKTELSHCIERYQQNVENIKKDYVFSFSSLSRYEMLERKEEFVRRLAQYEAQEDLLFRENAKVYYAIGSNDYCIDSCNANQQEWTLSDFNDAFIALDIKAEIEALRFSIQECDKLLNKELYDLEHALKDAPLNVVKDKELDLIKQTKSFDDAISKVINELKIIKNDLDVSNLQKNAFNQRSIAERFKGLFTGAHRQEFLLDEKIKKCQESVRDKEHELLIFRKEKAACDQQVEYTKKIYATKEIELQQQREREIQKQSALERAEINQPALFEQETFKQVGTHYQQQHEQASLEQVPSEIRDYILDAQTESFLVEHGMQISDYTQIMGNLLQHNLHSELCSQLKKAARIAGIIHHQNDLIHQAVLFVDAGVASNKAELYNLTLSLLDASDGLIGFVQAMSKETSRLLYVAGKQAIETVMDLPATTIHGIIDMYRFLEMVKEQVIPPNSLSSFEFNNVQSCDNIGDTFAYRKEFIINSLSYLSQASLDWIAHRSAHDKAEDIVKFATDAIVNVIAFEAVIAKVAQACKFLTQGMGHARALELAENLLIHEPEIVPALEAGLNKMKDPTALLKKAEKRIADFEQKCVRTRSSVAAGNKKRVYTGVNYHHKNSRGGRYEGKSPAPKDGQKVLDNSIPFKIKGNQGYERRLGVEEDYFVILDEHRPGEFHGHTESWNGLTDEMKNFLRKSYLIKK